MGSRVVVDPSGRRWVVRRRWAPRLGSETFWRRFRRRTNGIGAWARGLLDGTDLADVGCLLDETIVLVVAAIGLVLLVLLSVFVIIPVLVALLDVVVLLLLAALGVVARIVFRRPWTIEARTDDGTVQRWKVVGWRASRERRNEVADLLVAGIVPPA